MTRISLEFEVVGEVQLSRFFDLAEKAMADLRPIFEAWGTDFRERQHGVFAAEGAFEGRQKWADLSPKYREWKEARYPGQPILKLTGAMRDSLTRRDDPNHVEEIREDEFVIGTRDPKAIVHQKPETAPLPQRKVIELTDPQKVEWVRLARLITWEQLQAMAAETRIARQIQRRLDDD